MTDGEGATRTVVRDGLVVEGPDAASWLQGQLSQDVETMAAGASRESLVLSPQGKLDSYLRVTREGDDRFLLDLERGFGESLTARLARFKLRVKATLEPVAVVCRERANGGFDRFGPPEIVPASELPAGEGADEAVFEAARIRAGVPRLGRELTERTIPQEAGDELVSRTVSFEKGGYTGQELVARVDSRGGNVPRRLRLVRGGAYPDGSLPLPGDAVEVAGAPAGELTSVAPDGAGGFVALGLVKRAALATEEIGCTVAGEAGVSEGRITVPGGEAASWR